MNDKLGIIACVKPSLMPYLDKYRRVLHECAIPYDVICWDRDGTVTAAETGENFHVFRATGWGVPRNCTDVPRVLKLIPMAQYRRYVLSLVRQHRYRKLIVLTSLTGTLIYDLLRGKYRNRYIFDYRDCSYEWFWPYAVMMRRLSAASDFTAVSSPGFRRYLPADKLVLCHNNGAVPETEEIPAADPAPFTRPGPLRISYIGHVRYARMNEAIVRQLANHPRFELQYVGNGAAEAFLHDLVAKLGARNVTFHSRFAPREKPAFFHAADLINNVYGNASIEVRYALSNRLYESVYFGRPIMTSRQTEMHRVVEAYGLGFGVELPSDDLAIAIERYVAHFDAVRFQEGCQRFWQEIRHDDEVFRRRLTEFIQG